MKRRHRAHGRATASLFGRRVPVIGARDIAVKLAQVNEQAFPKGLSPVTTRIERKDVPEATLAQWRQEFQDYTLRGEYDRFLETRALRARREAARTGAEPLLGVALLVGGPRR